MKITRRCEVTTNVSAVCSNATAARSTNSRANDGAADLLAREQPVLASRYGASAGVRA